MVCLGNICRSPLAQGILESKLPRDKFFIDSAGTSNYHLGSNPDIRSINVAKKHGIDISKQICRQLTKKDLDDFDIIYAMDKNNLKDINILVQNPNQHKKIKLILSEINTSKQEDIPDPYLGNNEDFEQVFKMLNNVCEIIAKKLVN